MTQFRFPFILISTLVLLCVSCKNEQPLYSSLEQIKVNKIYEEEGMIYVATEKGIWKKHNADLNSEWEGIGLHNKYVRDMIVFDDNTLLAGIAILKVGVGEVSLFRTTLGGQRWKPFLNNYGGDGGWTWLQSMNKHPAHSDTIFIGGSKNIARSIDRGETWESVHLSWENIGLGSYFVHINPENHENIWSGGQASIFEPFLVRSKDAGETWEYVEIFAGGDNVCFDVAVHPTDPDRVLVGLGGGILDVNAEEEINTPVFEATAYFRSLAISPAHPETVYAGVEDGESLKFYKTTDWGQNWETIAHLDGLEADVMDVLVLNYGNGDEVYLATTKGVFVYSNGTFKRF